MTDEAAHEAKIFLRLIRLGKMTPEEAKHDIVPDERQFSRVWNDDSVFWREIEFRKQVWSRLVMMLGTSGNARTAGA